MSGTKMLNVWIGLDFYIWLVGWLKTVPNRNVANVKFDLRLLMEQENKK